jgi:hypothetical protein
MLPTADASTPRLSLLVLLGIGVSLVAGVMVPACTCGTPPEIVTSCSDDAACPAGQRCVDRVCSAPGDGAGDGGEDAGTNGGQDGGGGGCTDDSHCGDGVCHLGECCGRAEQVCGNACCGSAEVCFANACVTPGDACLTQSDCPDGQICELSLKDAADGGMTPDAGERVCLGGATAPGRCIALPPRCGTPGADPETCIQASCEFIPTPGPLDAVVQWQWGQEGADTFPGAVDVWSTPVVGRLHDTNCDGRIDHLDPPAVVFVSANVQNTQCAAGGTQRCKDGVLRAIDGNTGQALWSLEKPEEGSRGFAGFSLAIGDITLDGRMEIVVSSGEGFVYLVSGDGQVLRKSDLPIVGAEHQTFGWGGAFAIGDMDGDGHPEIAYADQVFSTRDGALTRLFVGDQGVGGSARHRAISALVDLTGDGKLELLAGRTAYLMDGTILWNRPDLPDGYPAVADLDGDGAPEAVLVASGKLWILEGATGATELGPLTLPGTGSGGPPTVADFTGDGAREIGVAMADFYSALIPSYAQGTLQVLWSAPAHDFSSSVTGSTVFDFEGDGVSEVVYNDECFLWVYDGRNGDVKFVGLTTSFTATEASLVADVDGDGKAEILLVHNGVNTTQWHCAHHTGGDAWPQWTAPAGHPHYRGITLFRDRANAWVGTRALWNQHTYQVTNICSDRDTACDPPGAYGQIPTTARRNWELPWLNNFRQNVQESGLFDAPDPAVTLVAECSEPVRLRAAVRNRGLAILPVGVTVGFYVTTGGTQTLLGTLTTDAALFPGQAAELVLTVPAGAGTSSDSYQVRILVDPANPTFRECDESNNVSADVFPSCIG